MVVSRPVTLVTGSDTYISGADTAPQNAANGVQSGADRCPAAARTCSWAPRKIGGRSPATSHFNGSKATILMQLREELVQLGRLVELGRWSDIVAVPT